MTNLRKQIENLNNNMAEQVPQPVLDIFARSITELKQDNIESRSAKVGDAIPSFSLQNAKGETVDLDELLSKHDKIVLAFFRGVWCPYCNLELRALQQELARIEAENVKLVAISPQMGAFNEVVVTDNTLTFDVLTDANNAYAKQLGIDFELQDFAVPVYEQMGIDLQKFNNNDENSLPMPAVFVVDKQKTITYSFVDANYMNRIDIDELIAAL